MLNILARRHENVGILIYPAQVQGESAAAEVAAGVKYFNRVKSVDVIIVARGGGSIEDLAAFNDESLARTIAASTLPVISAVGHETDFTIADFVSDLRAATPSAAAELVIESKQKLGEHISHLQRRLARAADYRLLLARGQLNELAQHGAFVRMQDLISRKAQRVDELTYRLASSYQRQLRELRRRLDVASARIRHFDFRGSLAMSRTKLDSGSDAVARAMRARISDHRGRLNQLFAKLDALSPVKILERGYALVFDGNGVLVKDAAQLSAGEQISARVARGAFTAQVKDIQPE
jgi:exodeoxyribonuclease VII large subunit